ncbi:MAG: excinuclease ABC subunit C [Alphaproteobacteria bacterium]|nr:excinuclease ABC subunit C [Alphaproteobacteria bacterium]
MFIHSYRGLKLNHLMIFKAQPMQENSATHSPSASPKTGPEVIRSYLRQLPHKPGVYRMLGIKGDVLYVGKARSLKNRVSSYAKLTGQTVRIGRMIQATASMEFITTETETEALLLEANLIKRLKPYYNVLLRDDKSFPYILITGGHDFPQLDKHRGARSRTGEYFGPFANAGAVNRTLNTMQKAFLLRSCTDAVFENRTRPCLMHQIKRCSAPCAGYIDAPAYAALVAQARDFLAGGGGEVRAGLTAAMEQASEAMDFERAATFRDRIRAMSAVQAHQGINPQGLLEADVFAAYQEGGMTCIQVFFFRAGQNWGNRAYFPRADKSLSAEEILGPFLVQFYDNKPAPKLVLLSHAVEGMGLISEALSLRSDHRVELAVPKRGEKFEMVQHAHTNASEALHRRLAETASQDRLLQGVAEAFSLPAAPRRIEVYDNSHIQGSNAVGAMIVAGPLGFEKGQYRKFNIRSQELTPGDDYAMLREVLQRRFQRLLREGPREENGHWPDLLLIDGGAGQLSIAVEVLRELDITTVPLVAISKGPDRNAGRELFHMPGRPVHSLEPRDPVLFFLQRLRDEAHRFAIGAHRTRRANAATASPLDEMAGIGPRRKRALLNHFGSARAVSRAGLSDLEAVAGISTAMAKQIYAHFHDG